MKTLYADVYFLINFTVDLLALHFASRFSRVPTTPLRLILTSALGGIYAVVLLFVVKQSLLFFLFSAVFLLFVMLMASKGVCLLRRLRLLFSFLLFEVLLGGAVYYSYLTLEGFVPEVVEGVAPQNKRLLVFALIILMIMGAVRLFSGFVTRAELERSVSVKIAVTESVGVIEALLDSGNLLRDPTDLSPVMLIKQSEAIRLFPELTALLGSVDEIPAELKKRLRFVPISMAGGRKILFAVRPQTAFLILKKREEQIKLTLAIDNDGGTYGGYGALMPTSAIDNIK